MILLDFLEPRETINSDGYIVTLTKLKGRISRVRQELKTTFALQQKNSWPHTSLQATAAVARSEWTVLPHLRYSPDLAPSEFHVFGPVKDGIRGQQFPDNDAVIAAARKWLKSAGADFYERGT